MKLLLTLLILQSSLMASTPMEDDYSSAESTPIPQIPLHQHVVHTSYNEILQIGYIDIVIPSGSEDYQSCFVRRYKEFMQDVVLPSMGDYYLYGLRPDILQAKMHENALDLFRSEKCMLVSRFSHRKRLSTVREETAMRFIFKKP